MSLKRKRSDLSIKDKNEDVDDIVFQMMCKSVLLQLNVAFLISFARFCSSLIFIFSVIRPLDYPDYFVWSQRVRIIEVQLYNLFEKNKEYHLICMIKFWFDFSLVTKRKNKEQTQSHRVFNSWNIERHPFMPLLHSVFPVSLKTVLISLLS